MLFYSAAVAFVTLPLLKHFITNVLKCKAAKFKCVCITLSPLVMSPFSCDCIIMEID